MQTPKSRPGSLDAPQKPSSATPRTARKLKAPASESDSVSLNPVKKTTKDISPKVVDRRSPRVLATEKKRTGKVSELEPRIAQLQDELKKTKDQLSSSELCKRRAQQEAEEAKKQLASMSAELELSKKQLNELSESEESRIQELRKISQDRDRAWQSELEAVHKQHSMDSAAFASAMNEIQKLKIQCDRVSQSEASQARHAESAYGEIQSLRVELTETLVLVEKLKEQLNDCRESEARALEEVGRAQMELEALKINEENLKLEHAKAVESYNSLLLELEGSKNRVNSLEEHVGKENGECDDKSEIMKKEVDNLKNEVSQLRAALEASERRYKDEYIQSTFEIRNAYEMGERAKTESRKKEAELEAKMKETMAEVGELRTRLTEKQNILFKNEPIQGEPVLEDLNVSLSEKEGLLKSITEENEKLKAEILRIEIERNKANEGALMRLDSLTNEADNSCKRAARVTKELNAAQATNCEMEAELRRLKVQSDQWRKAAEAAAAMLSNNGKYAERTGSLEYHRKFSSSQSEDSEDDSPKKRNGNVLKKIGVLLKKGQK